jgi:hypothetical protein
MGACIIIGFEFALLYFAFWAVFLRRPAIYKVEEPIWGVYADHAEELHKHDGNVLLFSDRFEHGAEFVANRSGSSGPKAA